VKRSHRLWALVVVALCCRVWWLQWPSFGAGDSVEYLRLAEQLQHNHLYSDDGRVPSSYRPPLYPAVIAAIGALTGHPVGGVLILQVLLGVASVVLTYLIAEAMWGSAPASLAALMLAVAPMTGRYAAVVLTETLFTFLLVAAVWCWTRERYAVAGALLGLATLARASSLPFVLALGGAALIPVRGVPRRQLLIASAAALLTIAPWVLRNSIEIRRPVVADAGWGVNLLHGTVDLSRGSNRFTQLAAVFQNPTGEAPVPVYELERRNREQAIDWIRAHPLEWLRIRMRQWPWLFIDSGDYLPVAANRYAFRQAWQEGRLTTVALKAGFVLANVIVMLLAIAAAWMARADWKRLAPLWSFPIYLAVAHLPMYVEPRYGLPLVPFIVMFAARGAEPLIQRVRQPRMLMALRGAA